MSELTIRLAFPDDAVALRRLAQLDSSAVPAGALLIAELDGVLAAALSIDGRAAIADPFRPTAALVELLARRAQQLCGDEPHAKPARMLRSLRRNRTLRPAPRHTAPSGGC